MTLPQDESIRWLSCVTYNVQAGAQTARPRHYISRGWRQMAPSRASRTNLRRIAALIEAHDIIGLQEVDAGSWRTRQQNQVERLAALDGFDYWYAQVNRNLGAFAQHGIGLLSRIEPTRVTGYQLPGRVPGRGVLVAHFGGSDNRLAVAVAHLSLGAKSRIMQLAALGRLLAGARNAVILADTNCSGRALNQNPTLRGLGMTTNEPSVTSFPSWRPRRDLDHILVTPGLATRPAHGINSRLSDHRPVCQTIGFPGDSFGQEFDSGHRAA